MLPTGLNHQYIDNGEISVTKAPIEIPRTTISMLWHKRQDKDAGLQWLRMHMHDKMVTNWEQNMHRVNNCMCT